MKLHNQFKETIDTHYHLYELITNDDIYVEKITECGNVYLVHNHKTNQTYPKGKFYKTLGMAMRKAISLNREE